jgi:hypothetical protein
MGDSTTHDFVVSKNGEGTWIVDPESVLAKPGHLVRVTAIDASFVQVSFDPEAYPRGAAKRTDKDNPVVEFRIRPHPMHPQKQITYKFTVEVGDQHGIEYIDPEVIIDPPW